MPYVTRTNGKITAISGGPVDGGTELLPDSDTEVQAYMNAQLHAQESVALLSEMNMADVRAMRTMLEAESPERTARLAEHVAAQGVRRARWIALQPQQ